MAESFLKSIGASVLWKGLDRLAGLAKHIVIAATIGLSAQLDVFYMAIALLGVLVFSWASLFDVVAVPNMVRAWQENRQAEFRQIASGLFILTMTGSLFLAIILYQAKAGLANVAIGFDQDRERLLAEAIPWLLPVILLYIPLRLMGAVLRALRMFSPFYQAELITTLTVLLCVAIFREDGHVLLWSFSMGIGAAFVFLLIRTQSYLFPLANPFSPVVRQSLQMVPGLLILQAAHYIYVLTDRVFVSFLPEGGVSALAYGMALISLFPSLAALSGSFITVIAEYNDISKRSERLNDLMSMAIYIALGATAFMLMGGQIMVQVMLERGVFTASNTASVARSIAAYVWMILPLLLIGPLDQIFQVERRIGLIVRRTLLGMLANILLNAWFLFGLGWGLFGVAMATSISYWIMLLTGLAGVKQLGYTVESSRHLRWGIWNGVFLALAVIGFMALPDSHGGGIFALLTAVFLTSATMLLAGLVYRGHEQGLVHATVRRFLSRGSRI